MLPEELSTRNNIMAILSSIVKKLKIVTSGNIIIKKHHGNLSFRPLIWLIVPILALGKQILSELNDIIMPELEVTAYSMDEEITKINENKFYKIRMSANYKTGFWEVTIYTTQGLSVPASIFTLHYDFQMSSKDNRQKIKSFRFNNVIRVHSKHSHNFPRIVKSLSGNFYLQ